MLKVLPWFQVPCYEMMQDNSANEKRKAITLVQKPKPQVQGLVERIPWIELSAEEENPCDRLKGCGWFCWQRNKRKPWPNRNRWETFIRWHRWHSRYLLTCLNSATISNLLFSSLLSTTGLSHHFWRIRVNQLGS